MKDFLKQAWQGFLNVLIALGVLLALGGGAVLLHYLGVKVQ